MRSILKGLTVFAVLLTLTACDPYTEQLVLALDTGSPFNKQLAEKYRWLADEHNVIELAPKGLAAVDGVMTMPEKVSSLRDLDLLQARNALMYVLSRGARERAPYLSADAQAYFDCWAVTSTYKKWFFFDANPKIGKICKLEFNQAFSKLMHALNKPGNTKNKGLPSHIMEPIVPPPYENIYRTAGGNQYKGPYAPISKTTFIVFFEWDKDTLTPNALNVINAAADELLDRKHEIKKIHLTGHADTSGRKEYNDDLSVRRAVNVGETLMKLGIDGGKIVAEGRGEHDLLVQTPDNMREPSNRRVSITLE